MDKSACWAALHLGEVVQCRDSSREDRTPEVAAYSVELGPHRDGSGAAGIATAQFAFAHSVELGPHRHASRVAGIAPAEAAPLVSAELVPDNVGRVMQVHRCGFVVVSVVGRNAGRAGIQAERSKEVERIHCYSVAVFEAGTAAAEAEAVVAQILAEPESCRSLACS